MLGKETIEDVELVGTYEQICEDIISCAKVFAKEIAKKKMQQIFFDLESRRRLGMSERVSAEILLTIHQGLELLKQAVADDAMSQIVDALEDGSLARAYIRFLQERHQLSSPLVQGG